MKSPAPIPAAPIVGAFCPVFHRAVELIGRRWTGAIVRALLAGACRFGELTDSIPELSDRMLSERLKELESEGIVARTVIPATPVRIEYHLTEKGRALAPVFDAISAWSYDWLVPPTGEGH
ncbi:MAG: helix-turn-helix domain-containing protein [Chloroflexia bacterium]